MLDGSRQGGKTILAKHTADAKAAEHFEAPLVAMSLARSEESLAVRQAPRMGRDLTEGGWA